MSERCFRGFCCGLQCWSVNRCPGANLLVLCGRPECCALVDGRPVESRFVARDRRSFVEPFSHTHLRLPPNRGVWVAGCVR